MKFLAFNGSPRGTNGNTDQILQPFLEGAREAGVETETVYLKDKQICSRPVQQPKVAAKPTAWWDRVFAWWRTLNTPQQIGLVLFGVFVAWKIASS